MQIFIACPLLSLLCLSLPAVSNLVEPVSTIEENHYSLADESYECEALEFRTSEPNKEVMVRVKIPTRDELTRHHSCYEGGGALIGEQQLEIFTHVSRRFFDFLRDSKGDIKALFNEELRNLERESWECCSKALILKCSGLMNNTKRVGEYVKLMQIFVPGACRSIQFSSLAAAINNFIYFSPARLLSIMFPKNVWHQRGIPRKPVICEEQHSAIAKNRGPNLGSFRYLLPKLLVQILELCDSATILQFSKTSKENYSVFQDHFDMIDWHLSMITQEYLVDTKSVVQSICSRNHSMRKTGRLLRGLVCVVPPYDGTASEFSLERFPFYTGGLDSIKPDKLLEFFKVFNEVFSSSPPSYVFNSNIAGALVDNFECFIAYCCKGDSKRMSSFCSAKAPFVTKFLEFLTENLDRKELEMLSQKRLFRRLSPVQLAEWIDFLLSRGKYWPELIRGLSQDVQSKVRDLLNRLPTNGPEAQASAARAWLSFPGLPSSGLFSSARLMDAAEQRFYDFTHQMGTGETLNFHNGSNGEVVAQLEILTQEELSQYHKSDYYLQQYEPFIKLSMRLFDILRDSKGNAKAVFGEELQRLERESWKCFDDAKSYYPQTNVVLDYEPLTESVRCVVPGAGLSIPLADLIMQVAGTIYFSPTKCVCNAFPSEIWRRESINRETLLPDQCAGIVRQHRAAAGPFGHLPFALIAEAFRLYCPDDLGSLVRVCKLFHELLRNYYNAKDRHLLMIARDHLVDTQSTIGTLCAPSGYAGSIEYQCFCLRNWEFVGPYKEIGPGEKRRKSEFVLERFPFYAEGFSNAAIVEELSKRIPAVFSVLPSYVAEPVMVKELVIALRNFIEYSCGKDTAKMRLFLTSNASFIKQFFRSISSLINRIDWDIENALIEIFRYLAPVDATLFNQHAEHLRRGRLYMVFELMKSGAILQIPD